MEKLPAKFPGGRVNIDPAPAVFKGLDGSTCPEGHYLTRPSRQKVKKICVF